VVGGERATGNPLTVLGVEVTLTDNGARFRPSEDKIRKWTAKIESILECGKLCGGEASKLAGALQWAAQHTFKRLGRAMIRPIIKQETARSSEVGEELRLALQWWLEVFRWRIFSEWRESAQTSVLLFTRLRLSQERTWKGTSSKPIHMFCDARSTPPRVAAVLLKDGERKYCDLEPPAAIMGAFQRRKDNQIMGLEILSIALGAPVLKIH